MSGSTNAGEAFDLTATREAKDSTYAGIVRLVEAAQASKAPMSRLADRWSLGFLAVTVAIARGLVVHRRSDPGGRRAGRRHALSADPGRAGGTGRRPVARGAFRGADQGRGAARDDGAHPHADPRQDRHADRRPAADRVDRQPRRHGEDDILRLAAALDQASKHPVAQAIVAAAKARGFALPVPSDVAEIPGEGVVGHVEGRKVIVGGDAFVASRVGRRPGDQSAIAAGSVLVAVAVDGHMAGHLVMSDPLREGAGAMLDGLRRRGSRASCWPPATAPMWPSA
jgi:cation transport ATPase